MTSVAGAMQESGEDVAREAVSRGDQDRNERWAAEAEDRKGLRASLEEKVEDEFTQPKPRPDDDAAADLRATAEKAWQETHFAAEERERAEKRAERLQELADRVEREHAIDGVEGLERILNAEQVMRTSKDPREVIALLQSTGMLDGSYDQQVQQITHASALTACEKFFDKYDVPARAEKLMMAALEKGEIKRTGNFERDLMSAYRHIMKGADRVIAR